MRSPATRKAEAAPPSFVPAHCSRGASGPVPESTGAGRAVHRGPPLAKACKGPRPEPSAGLCWRAQSNQIRAFSASISRERKNESAVWVQRAETGVYVVAPSSRARSLQLTARSERSPRLRGPLPRKAAWTREPAWIRAGSASGAPNSRRRRRGTWGPGSCPGRSSNRRMRAH